MSIPTPFTHSPQTTNPPPTLLPIHKPLRHPSIPTRRTSHQLNNYRHKNPIYEKSKPLVATDDTNACPWPLWKLLRRGNVVEG